MPIFGKESPVRKRRRLAGFTEKLLDTVVSRQTVKGKSVRVYKKTASTRRYDHESTLKEKIEKEFRVLFPSDGKNFIERRFQQTGKPVVVLDWGCGRGVSIGEFADKYRKMIRPYGFGKDSYTDWKYSGNVKFIQATAKDLFSYLTKIGPVDLIYSHIGLMWLFPTEGLPKEKVPQVIKDGVNYVERLVDFVAPEGKIAFNISPLNDKEIVQRLKKQLKGKAQVKRDRYQVYITKIAA